MVKCWFGGYKVGGCKNNIYKYYIYYSYYILYILYINRLTAQTIFNLLTF